MKLKSRRLPLAAGVAFVLVSNTAHADERARRAASLQNLNHIIVVMQENHSFDNYFGALAYAPGSVYHPANAYGGCRPEDHRCVDGLTCSDGALTCSNFNVDVDGGKVFAFHDTNRCVKPDLDHGWVGSHIEANFADPNAALLDFRGDGFVRRNDQTEQIDNGNESPTDDETMGFYTQAELPFYYDLAQKFAISDRHFCSVLGPTFPNRSYSLAATSFGHLTTSDELPPTGSTGYKPLTGTIFDLLDAHTVTWAEYFQDVPAGGSFRQFTSLTAHDPHFIPFSVFLQQVSGVSGLPALPQVSFVDPNFGFFSRSAHRPTSSAARLSCPSSLTRCATGLTGRTRSSSSPMTSTVASTITSGRPRRSRAARARPTAFRPGNAQTPPTRRPAPSREVERNVRPIWLIRPIVASRTPHSCAPPSRRTRLARSR
jgi:Phosphoesterase family